MNKQETDAIADIIRKNLEKADTVSGTRAYEAIAELGWDLADYFSANTTGFDRNDFHRLAGIGATTPSPI